MTRANPPSDKELLQLCRQGDPRAWETVIEKYGRLVYSIPLNYGLTGEDAADISQIVFTILFQSLQHIREEERLGGWLATVAKRHTWRYAKKKSREITSELSDLAENTFILIDHTTSEQIERTELLEWLDDGLTQLGERCQRLLTLLYFQDETTPYEQVAQQLNIPLGSIGPTRARCLQKLRAALQNLEKSPS